MGFADGASIHFKLSIQFFFNDTATTEIYTLSLHDALPISPRDDRLQLPPTGHATADVVDQLAERSEEHTSELQAHHDLVCRLLLEKKKKKKKNNIKNKKKKQKKNKKKKKKKK